MSATTHHITDETFRGLAFPIVKVRYAGPTDTSGSRWIATCYRDTERSYRAIVSYDDALPSGAQNAIVAARKCYGNALAENNPDASIDEYVAIPADLSASEYAFTFVPSYILNHA